MDDDLIDLLMLAVLSLVAAALLAGYEVRVMDEPTLAILDSCKEWEARLRPDAGDNAE